MADAPDPYALLTATEGVAYMKSGGVDVSIQAVINWRNRGHLTQRGWKNGRPAYWLIDFARAERQTCTKARRR